jgi:4-amino-4-deoxy-L-arabinose transferase-like glycosyltransferase
MKAQIVKRHAFAISFILILVLAFVLRFYKLGSNPPGLDWDENSNAYNAYSILVTGRDEHKNFLPVTNQSFDDYKPPLYMYLNVPTVAVFGLTPFAARLPSAFFGFLTVPLFYYLSKKILEGQKFVDTKTTALIAMLLLAIAPWHLQFSRVGFEANVALFMSVAAISCIFLSFKKPKALILSAILAGLAIYGYHSERVYLPLLIIALVVFFRKDFIFFPKKIIISSIVVFVIALMPLALLAPRDAITQRFQTTTIASRIDEVKKSIEFQNQDKKANIPFGNLIHNRRLFTSLTIIDNYLWHFDFNYLFIKGDDNFRHHIEGMGMLYFWQLPLIIYGIYLCISRRTKGLLFILAWLLIVPIAASPARPAPHAIRSFAMVIPLTLITSIGLMSFLALFKKRYRLIATAFVALIIIFAFFSYLESYYIQYPLQHASDWQYGYNLAAEQTSQMEDKYKAVRIDGSVEQAYIFWLFSKKYDPVLYQKNGSREKFGKYIFNAVAPTTPDELFVRYGPLPSNFKVIKTINLPNGNPAIQIGSLIK